jgi:hypothetical protein
MGCFQCITIKVAVDQHRAATDMGGALFFRLSFDRKSVTSMRNESNEQYLPDVTNIVKPLDSRLHCSYESGSDVVSHGDRKQNLEACCVDVLASAGYMCRQQSCSEGQVMPWT